MDSTLEPTPANDMAKVAIEISPYKKIILVREGSLWMPSPFVYNEAADDKKKESRDKIMKGEKHLDRTVVYSILQHYERCGSML
ncbi:hypothetical protein RB195_015766 [Necator americanus]|uniref:Uncharacterized protein n=1 Tax=Necator americanus TaxID=51031 RepID=A0ABR1E691_NECAM